MAVPRRGLNCTGDCACTGRSTIAKGIGSTARSQQRSAGHSNYDRWCPLYVSRANMADAEGDGFTLIISSHVNVSATRPLMTDETRCESKVAVPVHDEHRKRLPDEWKQCEHDAVYLVERQMSGLSSSFCGGHISWYRKLEGLGQVTIVELKGEGL